MRLRSEWRCQRGTATPLPAAALCLSLAMLCLPPAAAFGQTGTGQAAPGQPESMPQNGQTGAYRNGSMRRRREAMRMVPAQAALDHNLDSNQAQMGHSVTAKLAKTVQLQDGAKLPDGTELTGTVEQDDLGETGRSKLALRFTEAKLPDGTVVPVKATIVGIAAPETRGPEGYPMKAGREMPNSWTDGTLRVDQLNVNHGIDLHSRISSRNSGVFVSKTGDSLHLNQGTELELAIAARRGGRGNGRMYGQGGAAGNQR